MSTSFHRSLKLLDATMIVAGSMIGSGIFIVSADIARHVGSPGLLLLVWILTGTITLIAAVSFGELSAMFPKAGGQYVYIKESFNSLIGFLYGWAMFLVIQTGTIAAVGVGFAKFTSYLIKPLGENNILLQIGHFHISAAQLVAIALIVFLTWVNSRGIENGKWIQTLFTLTKIVSFAGLIIFGLYTGYHADIWRQNWADGWNCFNILKTGDQIFHIPISGFAIWTTVAVAMVGSIFSSDAWNNVTFIAGEVQNPQRNIGLSLFFGTVIVTVIYILMNTMYLSVLPIQDIAFAKDDRVGVAAANAIFGETGTMLMALMMMVSTFGCNNGLILAGARVYNAMAVDGLFFKKTAELNKFGVPGNGLWLQCIWASLLCLTGKYGDLLDYVIFVVLIFYALTIAGIFILRVKQPNAERPYKAFGYPVLPAIYILAATFICLALLVYKPWFTWPGLGIVLAGIPVYYLFLHKK